MDLIQATVRLNIDGDMTKAEIVRAGPNALTPAEALVLAALHGEREDPEYVAIRNARVVGVVERTAGAEIVRLRETYESKIVDALFPSPRQVPMTLEDTEFPATSIAEDNDPTAVLRARIVELGGKIPSGNVSREDLQAILTDLSKKAS